MGVAEVVPEQRDDAGSQSRYSKDVLASGPKTPKPQNPKTPEEYIV